MRQDCRLTLTLIGAGLAAAIAAPAQAADCAREDIDHYLDRGFTPQQVLALCRPGEPAAAPAEAESGTAISFLRDALAVYDLRLDADSLRYSRELCVEYDEPNLAQQRKRACGVAHYRIGREGLEVVDSSRKLLFWGSDALTVTSPAIDRDYALGQEQLKTRDQRELAAELEQGPTTRLPVRSGVPLERVRAQVNAIAKPSSTSGE